MPQPRAAGAPCPVCARHCVILLRPPTHSHDVLRPVRHHDLPRPSPRHDISRRPRHAVSFYNDHDIPARPLRYTTPTTTYHCDMPRPLDSPRRPLRPARLRARYYSLSGRDHHGHLVLRYRDHRFRDTLGRASSVGLRRVRRRFGSWPIAGAVGVVLLLPLLIPASPATLLILRPVLGSVVCAACGAVAKLVLLPWKKGVDWLAWPFAHSGSANITSASGTPPIAPAPFVMPGAASPPAQALWRWRCIPSLPVRGCRWRWSTPPRVLSAPIRGLSSSARCPACCALLAPPHRDWPHRARLRHHDHYDPYDTPLQHTTTSTFIRPLRRTTATTTTTTYLDIPRHTTTAARCTTTTTAYHGTPRRPRHATSTAAASRDHYDIPLRHAATTRFTTTTTTTTATSRNATTTSSCHVLPRRPRHTITTTMTYHDYCYYIPLRNTTITRFTTTTAVPGHYHCDVPRPLRPLRPLRPTTAIATTRNTTTTTACHV